ncbi:hypothetical protein ACFWH4_02115 [Streptomyces sp. NPDC127091]|uniref:hypothetical protein n=1 Tax=Streptomyces sp. NPDC127091 TaxID=3347134 RepID=UPI0036546FE8
MTRDPHSPVSARPEPPSPPNTGLPSEAPPLLSVHATVVFLAAGFIGVIMGGLMFLSEKSVPTAVGTGLGVFGASVPVLHKLIG